MYVLSGDIGGTNTRLQVSCLEDNNLKSIALKKYKGIDYSCLMDIIFEFLAEFDLSDSIDSVCLAVAGFVSNGEVEVT